ncbi:bacteriocin biosynthesis protein SagD [Halorientalis sp. IM1011]|uniref:YcaO-like family protein n=1 Tax=Halorientalis sp. IM1011 TaxID=1932360 RepID=UPI00097CD522|nr:YcaO-like family protein [Halorientalis sp. IM1011]AQL44047.1 bacteriocin biosynthesis protein SagD [Halorientalis sp. IM1011]
MTVALVGSGPAREAVAAALGDVDAQVTDLDPAVVGGSDLAVVVGQAGDVAFETVDERAREAGVPWLAVEIGGVGGYPVVEAAVAGFGPGTACYRCLQSRVRSNADPDQEPQAAPDPETARFAGAIAGREAAKLVGGKRSSVIGSVIEVPHAQRQFLPVPGCVCAGERDRRLHLDHVDRDLEEALTRAEQGLDDRVGVVAEVGEAESFPAPYYLANVADTSEFSDATAPRQAAGVDADWNAAFMKALGEGYERYSAGVYRTAEFETGTAAEIDDAVPPSTFVCADGDGWATADEHTEVEWVPGRNLDTDGDVWLPAEFVHFPPPTERFRPAVTTGLGLGNSTVEALLSGLYEIIERDAAMLSWYSTFDPLGLSVEDETFGTLRRRAKSEGLDVVPLLLTQDVDVPVVAAAVHREEWPRFAVGLSAHLDPARAARSALAEALQNWLELRGMGREDAMAESGAIGHFADFPGEAQTFLAVGSSVPAEQVGPAEVPAGRDHLDAVVERLRDADLDVYGSRLTTRDVDALGFEAVRAVVPSAQPLFFDAPYFGERAESVPQSMGFEARLDRDHHPYP